MRFMVVGDVVKLHHSPEAVLYKLAPCAAAAQDKNAKVPKKCGTQIKMETKAASAPLYFLRKLVVSGSNLKLQ